MIIKKRGCVIKAFKEDVFQILIHQCNLLPGVMKAGFAKQLSSEYPELVNKDIEFKKGKRESEVLGRYSFLKTDRKKGILNIYAQKGLGRGKTPLERSTSYDAFFNAFYRIEKKLAQADNIKSIGVPAGIGCGLGGGNLYIVKAILEEIFNNSRIDLYIFEK